MLGGDKVCTERMIVVVPSSLKTLSTECFNARIIKRLHPGLQQEHIEKESTGISAMNGSSYIGRETNMKYSWRGFKFASLRPIDMCTKIVLMNCAPIRPGCKSEPVQYEARSGYSHPLPMHSSTAVEFATLMSLRAKALTSHHTAQ